MSLLTRVGFMALLAVTLTNSAFARDEVPAAAAQGLVSFASDEGLARLARSAAKVDFPVLANQFEAQTNSIFCGPTTAAIVLNAVRVRSAGLPRDHSRLRAEDLRNITDGYDPVIARFTQDNVINPGPKTRAQVMGDLMTINGKKLRDFGYQARQFEAMLKANAVRTRLVIVDDKMPEETIRIDLVENLKRRGDYVAVNYLRSAAGQEGGGHISPLGAYDAESDSFLVLDVNPDNTGWVWMPAATLVKGMRTFDKFENRGYIQVESR
jgi:hypothetical protein